MSPKNRFLLFLFILLIPVGHLSATGFVSFGHWQLREPYLTFTTASASTFHNFNCSAALVLERRNAFGALDSASATISVSLNVTGQSLSFFSDSDCMNSIAFPQNINVGSSSITFYAKSTAAGSSLLTASATGYSSGQRNVTITSNPFIWTGAVSNVWQTNGNWSGGVYPGTSDVAILSGAHCSTNCSPSRTSGFSPRGIIMLSDYTGTVTSTAQWLIGAAGIIMQGGSFTASHCCTGSTVAGNVYLASTGTFTWNAATTLTFSGNVFHSAGTLQLGGTNLVFGGDYTATTALAVINGSSTNIQANRSFTLATSTNFNKGTSTLHLYANTAPVNFAPEGASFNNLKFDRANPITITGTVKSFETTGMLSLNHGSSTQTVVGPLTMNARGNVELANFGMRNSSSIQLNINGSGAQTITGCLPATEGNCQLPNTEINSTGTVTLTGTIGLGYDYNVVSNNVTATAADIWFKANSSTYTFGSETYGSLGINTSAGITKTLNSTLKINGNTIFKNGCCPPGFVSGSAIEISGNLLKPTVNWHPPGGGTSNIVLTGNSNVTIGDAAQYSDFRSGSLVITKNAANTITLNGEIRVNQTGQSLIVNSGILMMNGKVLNVKDLVLNGNTMYTGGGTLTVNGTNYATTPGSYSIFGGTVINP